MSLYLDGSSFVHLLTRGSHSHPLLRALEHESAVIISELAELEARVHLRGMMLGGRISAGAAQRAEDYLVQLKHSAPFECRHFPTGSLECAMSQLRITHLHCRTLDRLHLACMQQLSVTRLLTYDLQQARAAVELGFEVLTP
jgi:predicted nucleic acid-binding protein